MTPTLKIVSLGIGLTAFIILLTLGSAVWVFIPLFPAGIIFVIAVLYATRGSTTSVNTKETDSNSRKAA